MCERRLELMLVIVALAGCADDQPMPKEPTPTSLEHRDPQPRAEPAKPEPSRTEDSFGVAIANDFMAMTPAEVALALSVGPTKCDGGNAGACVVLGGALLHERDVAGVDRALQRSCDLGMALGCTRLAAMLEAGAGGFSASLVRAGTLFEAACKLADDIGCARFARATARGYVDKPDEVRAFKTLKSFCDGHPDASYSWKTLGGFYANGVGTPANVSAAKAAWVLACGHGDAGACDAAAKLPQ